jgi:hypothetical protein
MGEWPRKDFYFLFMRNNKIGLQSWCLICVPLRYIRARLFATLPTLSPISDAENNADNIRIYSGY